MRSDGWANRACRRDKNLIVGLLREWKERLHFLPHFAAGSIKNFEKEIFLPVHNTTCALETNYFFGHHRYYSQVKRLQVLNFVELVSLCWAAIGRWREQVRRRTELNSFQLSTWRIQFFLNGDWKWRLFFLSQSLSASVKLSNCISDRTILFLSAMFKIALIANRVQIKWDKCIRKRKKSSKMPPFPPTSCIDVTEISIDDIVQRTWALSNLSAFRETENSLGFVCTAGTNGQNVQMVTCPLPLPMWIFSSI